MKKSINNPNVLSEIYERIDKLKSDTKGKWGKMNVNQMMCHVRTAANFAFEESIPDKKPGFFNKTILKWMLFNIPPPKNSKTYKDLDMVTKGINPPDFNIEMKKLKDVFGKISASNGPFKSNPLLGDLTKSEWGIICYIHADYHLKQFSA